MPGVETGRLASSPTLQFVTLIALGLRQPVLLNRGLGFVDQMPGTRLGGAIAAGVKKALVASVVDGRISFDVALAREPTADPSPP